MTFVRKDLIKLVQNKIRDHFQEIYSLFRGPVYEYLQLAQFILQN